MEPSESPAATIRPRPPSAGRVRAAGPGVADDRRPGPKVRGHAAAVPEARVERTVAEESRDREALPVGPTADQDPAVRLDEHRVPLAASAGEGERDLSA